MGWTWTKLYTSTIKIYAAVRRTQVLIATTKEKKYKLKVKEQEDQTK